MPQSAYPYLTGPSLRSWSDSGTTCINNWGQTIRVMANTSSCTVWYYSLEPTTVTGQVTNGPLNTVVCSMQPAHEPDPVDRFCRRERARHRLARIKAEQLLLRHLTSDQKQDLRKYGYFKVYVAEKVYRIRRGRAQNVDLVREEAGVLKPIETLCLHPDELVPDADTMLIQKLLLETDERQFLSIANHMPQARMPDAAA